MSSETQQIIDALNGQRQTLDNQMELLRKQTADIATLKNRVSGLERSINELHTGPVDVNRLRWGAREILLIFIAIIIPAMSAYYGAKTQTDQTSDLLRAHIARHEG